MSALDLGIDFEMPKNQSSQIKVMGIGGGVMGVSVMTLYKISIHRAVSTAAFFGFLISIPGTVGFMITGLNVTGLPFGNVGYVSFIGFFIIAPAAYLMAPVGAKLCEMREWRRQP